jgi:hypothetical protein
MILTVHQALFGRLWHNGRRPSSIVDGEFPNGGALELIAAYKVRALPQTAADALIHWAQGRIHLQMFTGLPPPEEVLRLQCQGIRCVSVLKKSADIRDFSHEGRDFFSFMVHDLIHARLMTVDPENFRNQVKFARWLNSQWEDLQRNLAPAGRMELEYMASDMNSHIIHLLKTFKSWIARHRPDLLPAPPPLDVFSLGDRSFERRFQEYWRLLNRDVPDGQHWLHHDLLELWRELPSAPSVGLHCLTGADTLNGPCSP